MVCVFVERRIVGVCCVCVGQRTHTKHDVVCVFAVRYMFVYAARVQQHTDRKLKMVRDFVERCVVYVCCVHVE